MKSLSIAAVNLRRFGRDRTALFFVVLFPFLLILAIGATFGEGFDAKVGVVAPDGNLARALVARLERVDSLAVETFDGRDGLTDAVERGDVEAGLIVPIDYDRIIRAGATARLTFLARPGTLGQELRLTIDGVLAGQSTVLHAARFAASEGGESFDRAASRATDLATTVPRITVRATVAGTDRALGEFDAGAAQQLVLFMFVSSLAGSAQLIETRRLGVTQRMLSTPTSAREVIAGEAIARYGLALLQGLIIVFVSLAVFGVGWGDPLGTAAVVLLFAGVGAGAAMLMGSTLQNAQQAGSLGVFFGLVLAALGGCMVPLEVMPEAMRTVAHITPHAWANDALGDMIKRGGISDALKELGVLTAYTVVLVGAAIRRLRTTVTGAAG